MTQKLKKWSALWSGLREWNARYASRSDLRYKASIVASVGARGIGVHSRREPRPKYGVEFFGELHKTYESKAARLTEKPPPPKRGGNAQAEGAKPT